MLSLAQEWFDLFKGCSEATEVEGGQISQDENSHAEENLKNPPVSSIAA